MKPFFISIGPIRVTWFMAFSVFLIILGYIILKTISTDNKYKKEIEDLYLVEVISGFIGARLVYFILNYNLFEENIFDIIKLNHYNLSFIGGVLVSMVILYIITRIKNIPFFDILNTLLIPFYFSIAIGIWSFEFEGILSPLSLKETMIVSGIYILALVLHSLLIRKKEQFSILILILSIMSYYSFTIVI